ncbi:MAG TPA: helical backbone metal receptor [Candidatus Limnocylindria bacterium]|nr:helical backbone metal receptor [Candidatus Limnocylindria bacterium]
MRSRLIACPPCRQCSRRGQRWRARAAALLALLLAARGAAAPPPERIVALAPSTTEIVFALGAGERLVGTCGQCDYPEAARRVPRIGSYLVPSVEAVLAVRPDLVIAVPTPANREAVRALERIGTPVLVVRDRVLADLWDAIASIGAATGETAAARALERRLRARLAAVAACTAGLPRPRVLMVVGHRPLIVVGGDTLQDELIAIAGGENVGADIGAAFPQTSLEIVAARAPDVIVDAAMGSEAKGTAVFSAYTQIPAVRTGRVVPMDADELLRTGPRVAEAARRLAAVIHPGADACR